MRSGQPVTEDHVSGRADLDLRSTLDLVELINEEDAGVPAAVAMRPPARGGDRCDCPAARKGWPADLRRRGLVRPARGGRCRRVRADVRRPARADGRPRGRRRRRARGRPGGGRGRRESRERVMSRRERAGARCRRPALSERGHAVRGRRRPGRPAYRCADRRARLRRRLQLGTSRSTRWPSSSAPR